MEIFLYFHRIDAYCIINYDIKYIVPLKTVLIKDFLMKLFKLRAKVRF